MMTTRPHEVWYRAENGKGYTKLEEHALKDTEGNPICDRPIREALADMAHFANTSMTKKKYPYVYTCDTPGCPFRVGADDLEPVEHVCYSPKRGYLMDERDENGQQYSKPGIPKSILEKLWDSVDSEYRVLMAAMADPLDAQTATLQKGKCRGLAIAIQMLAIGHYKDVNAVVAQVQKRYQMAIGKIPQEPTPGYFYNPPAEGSEEYKKALRAVEDRLTVTPAPTSGKKASPGRDRVTNAIPASKMNAATNALKMGMSPKEVAGLLNVSEASVELLKSTIDN